MTPEQTFKVEFLKKCAEFGLTVEETHSLVKEGIFGLDALVNAATSGVKSLGTAGTIGALAAPPLVGYAGGTALAKMQDVDDTDVDEMKQRHLINEYRRLANDIRNRRRETIA